MQTVLPLLSYRVGHLILRALRQVTLEMYSPWQPSSHLHKHLPPPRPNPPQSVHRRTRIDQSTEKVWENNLLATSSSMWQTKDYCYNEKHYSKPLNPKKTQWRRLVHTSVHALVCTIELWSTREVWRARKKRKSCPRR